VTATRGCTTTPSPPRRRLGGAEDRACTSGATVDDNQNPADGSRLSRSWQPCDRSALLHTQSDQFRLDKVATTPLDGYSLLTNRMHLALSRPTQSSGVCRNCKMPRSRQCAGRKRTETATPKGADRRRTRGTAIASYLPDGSVVRRRGGVRYSQHARIMVHSGRRRHRRRLRFALSSNDVVGRESPIVSRFAKFRFSATYLARESVNEIAEFQNHEK
jgi:hypothetical protein